MTEPLNEFTAAILQQMMADSHYTTNQLLESYKNEAEDANALVEAIRDRVGRLLVGDYMPTPDAIHRALYPSEKALAAIRKHIYGGTR